MAKTASMFRMSEEVGVVQSRYCNDAKKINGNCKEYLYYKANMCDTNDWNLLKGARYVLVPIGEL